MEGEVLHYYNLGMVFSSNLLGLKKPLDAIYFSATYHSQTR